MVEWGAILGVKVHRYGVKWTLLGPLLDPYLEGLEPWEQGG